jgi:hypothetical protein
VSALENPAQFALAGNATFTIESLKTGVRFTYRVRAAEDAPIHFVAVLTGPDNTQDYRYLGFIRRGVYFHGNKSSISRDAPSARAFDWFWRRMAQGDDISALAEVSHEGRCGRALTVPESIRSGYGPECISKV